MISGLFLEFATIGLFFLDKLFDGLAFLTASACLLKAASCFSSSCHPQATLTHSAGAEVL